MAIPLSINGAVFEYPEDFDENWGVNATGWAQAVTNGMLQRAGGNFPLLADVNFGASFGLVSLYYKSRSSNLATAGIIRLAKTDTMEWRNNANSADNILSVNTLDQLLYNGTVVGAAGGVTSLTGTANEIIVSSPTGDVTLSTPQAIATSSSPIFLGLTLTGLTASRALTTDSSDVLTSSATTAIELGFVSGVTSSIQSQINSTVTVANAALPRTGGTMSGAIAMGANKITGLADGTATTDAATFEQVKYFQAVQATDVGAHSTSSITYTGVGPAVTITPSSASHRIKITVTASITVSSSTTFFATLMRGAVNLVANGFGGYITPGGAGSQLPLSITYIDSPASTSALTYQVYIKNDDNTTAIVFGRNDTTAVITAEEIA